MKFSFFRESSKYLVILFFLCHFSLSAQNFVLPNSRYQTTDSLSKLSFKEFKNKFEFNDIYLVLAGPYPSSPSSAFGHIFILLEPKYEKERPLLMWDVINYAATVDKITSLDTYYDGLAGNLKGKYSFLPFHKKLREYTYIESRPLWLYPIKMTENEKNLFLREIHKQIDDESEYRFHDKNCASYLLQMLQNIFTGKEMSLNSLTTPRDVLEELKNKLGDPKYINSVENSLIAYDTEKVIGTTDAALLLTMLEWNSFKNDVLTSEQKNELQRLRVDVVKQRSTYSLFEFENERNGEIHSPMKIGFGILKNKEYYHDDEFLMNYRFGLHEFEDNHNVYSNYDYISLFNLEVGLQKNRLNVYKLWIFDQMSVPPINRVKSYYSWKLRIGSYLNHLYAEPKQATGIVIGFGQTYSLNTYFFISPMINAEFITLSNEGYSMLIGPSITGRLSIFNNLKMSYELGTYNQDFLDDKFNEYQNIVISYEFENQFQMHFEHQFTHHHEIYRMGIKFYIF